jgi:hypothetical protein
LVSSVDTTGEGVDVVQELTGDQAAQGGILARRTRPSGGPGPAYRFQDLQGVPGEGPTGQVDEHP